MYPCFYDFSILFLILGVSNVPLFLWNQKENDFIYQNYIEHKIEKGTTPSKQFKNKIEMS
jgi:hypothetical protein